PGRLDTRGICEAFHLLEHLPLARSSEIDQPEADILPTADECQPTELTATLAGKRRTTGAHVKGATSPLWPAAVGGNPEERLVAPCFGHRVDQFLPIGSPHDAADGTTPVR